jgi:hypothetical protein
VAAHGHRTRVSWRVATVASLAAGGTHVEAAAAGRVSLRTLARWSSDPAFRSAVQAARERLLETALGKAADLALEAVTTLGEIMRDSLAASASRVSAAKSILENVIRAREAVELVGRVAALEELVRDRIGNQGAGAIGPRRIS